LEKVYYVQDWRWGSGWGVSRTQRLAELGVRWLILAFAVWVAARLVGGIHLSGWQSSLAVALILGLLNLYLRPILVVLSLPITILTLGIFLIIVNAGLLYLASWLAEEIGRVDFKVDSFGAAILGAIIISIVSFVAGIFIRPGNIARKIAG
jgi:putative membrane protein